MGHQPLAVASGSRAPRQTTSVSRRELIVWAALVAAGALTRVLLSDLPNFAPVAAIALFAGYFFSTRRLALLAPLSVMAISDCVIGFYSWPMMCLVYGALTLPVLASGWLRRWLDVAGPGGAVRATAGLLGSSLAASLSFFIVTNFGSWLWFDLYQHNWAGLWQCYVQAIPFFRYTLTGDLVFAVVLFGGYALRCAWHPARDAVDAQYQV